MVYIFIIVIVVALLFVIGIYNGLVTRRNQVENAFAGIDVQLKKRYDLIPNLVEAVKGYMQHEKDVLARVIELRNKSYSTLTDDEKNELDNGMQTIANGLRVTVEKYPDLKASENVMMLQRSLNETEEQLAAARRSYNAAVLEYNNSLQTFPSNIFANMFGFTRRNFFEAKAEERNNVNVNL